MFRRSLSSPAMSGCFLQVLAADIGISLAYENQALQNMKKDILKYHV